MAFLSLTGLKNVSLPQTTAVLGDNGNNQGKPGGEGQLDLEYMMALAPGADTFYYSFSDLNPFNPANEGFLAYLYFVGDQAYPPLVHSLSYGDIEQNVFNASQPGSVEYGRRCDEVNKMQLFLCCCCCYYRCNPLPHILLSVNPFPSLPSLTL